MNKAALILLITTFPGSAFALADSVVVPKELCQTFKDMEWYVWSLYGLCSAILLAQSSIAASTQGVSTIKAAFDAGILIIVVGFVMSVFPSLINFITDGGLSNSC